jgi:hypothetical protein
VLCTRATEDAASRRSAGILGVACGEVLWGDLIEELLELLDDVL